VLVISISLLIGNQVPDAFGVKPMTITLEYTGPGATIHVEDKDFMNTHPTDPCGDGTPTPPCTTPVDVLNGEQFTVHPATGMDLESVTHFLIGTDEFFWDNKNDGKTGLHTSCSAPLTGEVSDLLLGQHTLKVLSQEGGSKAGTDFCTNPPPPPPPPDMVGGHGGITDNTALLVSGSHLTASWMIPLLVSAIGIGVFVVTRK